MWLPLMPLTQSNTLVQIVSFNNINNSVIKINNNLYNSNTKDDYKNIIFKKLTIIFLSSDFLLNQLPTPMLI